MMIRTISALAAFTLLTACAPSAPAPTPLTASQGIEAACAARGGKIQNVGRIQMPTCVIPFADAGKSCTDKAQCQGDCILEGNFEDKGSVTGQCQKSNVQFGCFAKVVNGQATRAMCVD
jgi:hypothetical protein